MVLEQRAPRRRTWRRLSATVFLAWLPLVADANPGDTVIGSANYLGEPAGGDAGPLSADGRYLVFSSDAPDVVPGPYSYTTHVYWRDRLLGQVVRVSFGQNGAEANGVSTSPELSDDGRFVVWRSDSTNLVPNTVPSESAVYLRDMLGNTIELINRSTADIQGNNAAWGPDVSNDGRYVVFFSDATNLLATPVDRRFRIYRRDRLTQTTKLISPVDRRCTGPRISGSGNLVAYSCDGTNATGQAYLRDMTTGSVELLSRASSGIAANGTSYVSAMTPDGRFVAIVSTATNLDGADTDDVADIYLRDRVLKTTELISLSSTEVKGNDASRHATLSDDGRYVAFVSHASNFFTGDTTREDSFVRDRELGTTRPANVDSTGRVVNYSDYYNYRQISFISNDGRFVAFATADALIASDTNTWLDVYIHELADTWTPPPPLSKFSIWPRAGIDFEIQPVGSSTTSMFWLKNRGTSVLKLTVSLRGTDASQFSIVHRCGSVAVGAGCAIKVTFKPTATGPKVARVRVVASDGVLRVRDVSGTAVQ